MSMEHYEDAVKLGERAVRDAMAHDHSPYLPALEEILKNAPSTSELQIGVYEIPLERLVGTYTNARKNAFGPNFMPLHKAGDEFAMKWSNLCDAHLSTGIYEPIKVYEYKNLFYVLEGNKRVSVFKYFGAVSIPGEIIRVLPPRDGSKESKVYYEYLDFFRLCPTLDLIFSEPLSYVRFQARVGKRRDEHWTIDEQRELHSIFTRFDLAYDSMHDEELSDLSSSDAFLAFLHYYPYRKMKNYTTDQLKRRLNAIRHELHLLHDDENVEIVLDADEGEQHNFLQKILYNADRHMKVAFIYARAPEESAWTYAQELGRNSLGEYFGDSVETVYYIAPRDQSGAEDTVKKAIEEGADIIFATSPLFANVCVKEASRHPEVKVLVCGINLPHAYIRSYYPRFYEAKFLSGIIAGVMSETNDIGYLSDYPIHANIAGANAFALGVQAVNPTARIHVQWTTESGNDPDAYFKEHKIRLISSHDLTAPMSENSFYGLYRFTDDGRENLAMTVILWGDLYRRLVETIRDGRWDSIEKANPGKALNYWLGFSDDVIDVFFAKSLPAHTRDLVEYLREGMRDGRFTPFHGRIRSQDGTMICDDPTGSLSSASIASMSWLNENIVGRIPAITELEPEARGLMLLQGTTAETIKSVGSPSLLEAVNHLTEGKEEE